MFLRRASPAVLLLGVVAILFASALATRSPIDEIIDEAYQRYQIRMGNQQKMNGTVSGQLMAFRGPLSRSQFPVRPHGQKVD